MKSRKIALVGMLSAATLVLSYIESVLPLDTGIPGIKPGIANIGVMIAIYLLGGKYAALVSLIRVFFAGILFKGFSAMLYSLSGAVSALIIMLTLKRIKGFGLVGVSVAGAIFHIIGQLLVAAFVTRSSAVWVYLPWLLVSSCVTGCINGIASGLIIKGISSRGAVKSKRDN